MAKPGAELIRRTRYDSPVVEVTPVSWRGRLLVFENWNTFWGDGKADENRHYLRLRDEQTDEIVNEFMEGFAFASAIVHEEAMYVYAVKKGYDRDPTQWSTGQEIYFSSSRDLKNWTDPTVILQANEQERLFNQSVCWDGKRFVMSYECDEGVPFTIKFAESDDLETWRNVAGAVYGLNKYAACPAIRFACGHYYMLYLERPSEAWWFETYLTRSSDLKNWEDSPRNPVLVPDSEAAVHARCPKHVDDPEHPEEPCPAHGKEINASDPDLIEWQGNTRVYFTGGCQHWGGYLQCAEFAGPMAGFFASYYD